MSALLQTVPAWSLSLARRLAPSGGTPMPRPLAQPAFGRVPAPSGRRAGGLRAMLRSAWRRHRTRQYLVGLDADALKDIGVTYAEAEAEANKPFWAA